MQNPTNGLFQRFVQKWRAGQPSNSAPDRDANPEDAYAAAVAYARRRRYDRALETLAFARDRGACSEAEALDLRARIFVQQGRWLDAESCWTQCKGMDGSNPVYEAALARLRKRARPLAPLCYMTFATLVLISIGTFSAFNSMQVRENSLHISQLGDRIGQAETATKESNEILAAHVANSIAGFEDTWKTLAKANDVRNTSDLLQAEIEHVGATVNSIQGLVANAKAINRQEIELAVGRLDPALEQIKANTSTLMTQVKDQVDNRPVDSSDPHSRLVAGIMNEIERCRSIINMPRLDAPKEALLMDSTDFQNVRSELRLELDNGGKLSELEALFNFAHDIDKTIEKFRCHVEAESNQVP